VRRERLKDEIAMAFAARRSGRGLLALALSAAALAAPSAASAAAPTVTATSVLAATESTAAVRGKVDSGARATEYRFDYIPLAAYVEDGEQFGEGTKSAPEPEAKLPAHPKATGDLLAGSDTVTNLTVTEGALDVGQAVAQISGAIPAGTTIKALDLEAATLTLSKPAEKTQAAFTLTTTGPQPVSAQLEGLAPGTAYRLRLTAHNGVSPPAEGATISFATLAPQPVYGPCPNDPFRSGAYAALGAPSARLPDCRAYEQVSPTEKDGADAVGEPNTVGAAPDGEAASFLSSFGMPGGEGSQTFPPFLGSRSGSGWSSAGLLPPAAAGATGYVIGHTPDFSYSLTEARRLDPQGTRFEAALFLREGASGPPRQIVAYQPADIKEFFFYVGASAEGRQLFFESPLALPPEEGAQALQGAIEGASNVYAYDTETGRLSLAAQLNSPSETEALLPHGAFAGPYEWARGSSAQRLSKGGAQASYYTQDTHAVAADGALFFTAAGSGQLYQRINPTEPQSPMTLNGQGEEECEDPTKACTYHVSATHKTNGVGTEDGSDPAGPAPAAFMAASEDGSTAYFTSPEKLTDDANTGPEVSPAQIGRAVAGEAEAGEPEEGFIPAHALGTAVSPDGEYLYWANPTDGTIGRAKLNGAGEATQKDPDFIEPGETEAETHQRREPGVMHSAPSRPRYVAVGPCAGGGECVYWTNTGPLGEASFSGSEGTTDIPVNGGGSIGRAKLDGSGGLMPGSVEHEFIPGRVETGPGQFSRQVFNPQGIAVNESHIYWANAATPSEPGEASIVQATIAGSEVKPKFFEAGRDTSVPTGVALSASYVYYGHNADVARVPLEGEAEFAEQIYLGQATDARGVAVDGSHIYWANRQSGAIGRAALTAFGSGECESDIPECEKHYLPLQGAPEGLAAGPESRLYFSVNGEAPTNPGNDLYRFQAPGAGGCPEARGCLTDLSAEAGGDGAEALGVLGASADGSYLYFVANGVLAANAVDNGNGPESAQPGDCHTGVPHGPLDSLSGDCNLYLAHEGQLRFIAHLEVPSNSFESGFDDAADWAPTPNLGAGIELFPRLAGVSRDGRVLSFLSSAPLTGYDTSAPCTPFGRNGSLQPCPEFYRYDADAGHVSCLTCNPTGVPPTDPPTLHNYNTPLSGRPGGSAYSAAVLARNLTGEGTRFFFQSTEALLGSDTDGQGDCPTVEFGLYRYPACQDVYEWEAPNAPGGSCSEASEAYSPIDEGCLYLLSPGNDAQPALFADADESGNNAFLFTRDPLVGQDQDQLFDLYDARAEGGLTSQNPLREEGCEGEACKRGANAAPSQPSPATTLFQGEGNVRGKPPRPRCPAHSRLVRRKGHTRCLKPHRRRHAKRHHGRSHR